MASQKHLHELLTQDQEPFHLHNYIANRRNNSHLNKPIKLPVTKSTSSKRASLYKQACFTSFQDSPDFLNSPLKHKHSGAATVLHVPPKTAAGLLEAAAKIHNKSSSKPKNVRFFFGSIIRKLKDKNGKTRELSSSSTNGPAFEAKQDQFVVDNSKDKYDEMGYVFSDCNYSNNISRRISSAGWSETNTPEDEEEEEEEEEDNNKSIDMDTISSCTSSRSDYYNQDFVMPHHPHFCLSPLSPFRFALHPSPSVGSRTPDFLSPSTSPCPHRTQEDDDQATDNSQKIPTQEEDEKDQCSPVSVLDLPFEDDEREDGREEEEEDEDDYDLECSYALMQKAKFQLLEKLRRFEKLAELEPIELEKRMLEGYDDEDDDYLDENEEYDEGDELEINIDDLICEIFSRSSPCNLEKFPGHMKRLVLDLIAEEKKKGMNNQNDAMVETVCKRLDSWKEVESNTIDMMVELDLRREPDGWKSYEEEVGDRAKEIELMIFGLLVEEISEELVRH